jgi:4-hydroxybenzoate polyprenyltransferase
MHKLIGAFIHSNIYISLAAVLLTVAAQIQLGLPPQGHPYLFIIFFATFFEYNLHRLITVLTNEEALNSEKHRWVRENLKSFYLLVFFSVTGFVIVVLKAKIEVLITLAPFALITFFYSVPVFRKNKHFFRLREIPYLKIFLIAMVWSATTILLPVVQSEKTFNSVDIVFLLTERFFFIFAISIPFDIRDREADLYAGLKTFPILLTDKRSMLISYVSLAVFLLISLIHYKHAGTRFIIWAMALSDVTTYLFLNSEKLKIQSCYYYGVLDGTMLLQGLLVLLFYYFTGN